MPKKSTILVRRVYENRAPGDGTRVLVDRLWPRGMTKTDVDFDEWCKENGAVDGAEEVVRARPEAFRGVRAPRALWSESCGPRRMTSTQTTPAASSVRGGPQAEGRNAASKKASSRRIARR